MCSIAENIQKETLGFVVFKIGFTRHKHGQEMITL